MREFFNRILCLFRGRSTQGKAPDCDKLSKFKERIISLKNEKDELKARIEALETSLKCIKGIPNVPFQDLEYNSDGLSVWGKNLEFLRESKFRSSYEKGSRSGHLFSDNPDDFHIEWRVHVVLWAAGIGLRKEGDFVECGVNTGILSLAIADYHNFAGSGKQFYLFDTFCGTPESQMTAEEREKCTEDNKVFYPDCYDLAKKNFSPYPNMHLIRGTVPDTLGNAGIGTVAYLSIDMNVAEAEVAAIEYFWEKLAMGAPIVLDDYAWLGCETQKKALDDFAARQETSILTLPTGQGLMFKS